MIPERDMLNSFASQLYNSKKVNHLFLKAEFNFSFNGIGFLIGSEKPSNDIESIIYEMIDYLSKRGYRILVTIDDASTNSYIKEFAHTFQGLIRKDYLVFLLMTGLYENISLIQNNIALTFLSRTPKLVLNPLSLISINESYKNIFNIDDSVSVELTKLTCGGCEKSP